MIGERLRNWRKAAGLSTTQAGRAAGLNQSYICALEHDKHKPSHETAAKLAQAYGVDVKELYLADPELQNCAVLAVLGKVESQRDRELAELRRRTADAENRARELEALVAELQASFEFQLNCIQAQIDTAGYTGTSELDGFSAAHEHQPHKAWDLEGEIHRTAQRYGCVDPMALAMRVAPEADYSTWEGIALSVVNQHLRPVNSGFEFAATDTGNAAELFGDIVESWRVVEPGDFLDDVKSLRDIAPDASDEWKETVRAYLYERCARLHGADVARRKFSREAVERRRESGRKRTDINRQAKANGLVRDRETRTWVPKGATI